MLRVVKVIDQAVGVAIEGAVTVVVDEFKGGRGSLLGLYEVCAGLGITGVNNIEDTGSEQVYTHRG